MATRINNSQTPIIAPKIEVKPVKKQLETPPPPLPKPETPPVTLAVRDGIERTDLLRSDLNSKFASSDANTLQGTATGSNTLLGTIIPPIDITTKALPVLLDVGERVVDAHRQVNTGVVETTQGIGHNIVESATDKINGAIDVADGLLKIGTARGMDPQQISEGWEQMKKGVGEIGTGFKKDLQTPVDAVLLGGGRVISAVQVLTGLEQPGRQPNQTEIAELKKVYGDSIDYSKIRLKEGYAGVVTMASGDRAMAHGNTIYMKTNRPDPNDPIYQTDPNRNYQSDAAEWQRKLVHESAHVWQNQNGGSDYMTEAIGAQRDAKIQCNCDSDSGAYDFEAGIKEGKQWKDLGPEQQAKLIDQAYHHDYFNNGVWREPVLDANGQEQLDANGQKITRERPDLTAYMNKVKPQLTSGQGAP